MHDIKIERHVSCMFRSTFILAHTNTTAHAAYLILTIVLFCKKNAQSKNTCDFHIKIKYDLQFILTQPAWRNYCLKHMMRAGGMTIEMCVAKHSEVSTAGYINITPRCTIMREPMIRSLNLHKFELRGKGFAEKIAFMRSLFSVWGKDCTIRSVASNGCFTVHCRLRSQTPCR